MGKRISVQCRLRRSLCGGELSYSCFRGRNYRKGKWRKKTSVTYDDDEEAAKCKVQAKLYVYPKYSKNLKIQDYNLDCYIVGDFRFYLM